MKSVRIDQSANGTEAVVEVECDCGSSNLINTHTGEKFSAHTVRLGSAFSATLQCPSCGKAFKIHAGKSVHVANYSPRSSI